MNKVNEMIDHNDHKISYDEYCKKILCNTQILARIIKECVSEFRDIPLAEITNYMENDPTMNINIDKAVEALIRRKLWYNDDKRNRTGG